MLYWFLPLREQKHSARLNPPSTDWIAERSQCDEQHAPSKKCCHHSGLRLRWDYIQHHSAASHAVACRCKHLIHLKLSIQSSHFYWSPKYKNDRTWHPVPSDPRYNWGNNGRKPFGRATEQPGGVSSSTWATCRAGFQSNSPLATVLQLHTFKNVDDGTVQPNKTFFLLTSYVFSYVSLDYYRTRWLLVFKAEIKDAYNTIQQCVFLEIMTQVLKMNNTSIFTLMFTSHHEKKPLAPEQMCVPAWKLLTRRIFLRNQVMISGNRHSYWVFQTFGRVITTSEVICGSIKLERRHVSLQQRPPKLSSSHQNHLLQRDTSQFRLGGNLNVFSFPCEVTRYKWFLVVFVYTNIVILMPRVYPWFGIWTFFNTIWTLFICTQRPATHDSGIFLPLFAKGCSWGWSLDFSHSRDNDAFWFVLVHRRSSIFRRGLTTDWANVCIGLRNVWAYILPWFPPHSAQVW